MDKGLSGVYFVMNADDPGIVCEEKKTEKVLREALRSSPSTRFLTPNEVNGLLSGLGMWTIGLRRKGPRHLPSISGISLGLRAGDVWGGLRRGKWTK